MKEIFLTVLHMSATGSVVILAVILARFLMKRAPKKYAFALWSVVGFRLLCPVTIKGPLSLFDLWSRPAETLPMGPAAVPDMGLVPSGPAPEVPMAPPQMGPSTIPAAEKAPIDWVQVLAVIWLVVAIGLMVYAVISELRLRRKLATAVRMEGNVYQSELVRSPFLLGAVRPRIYIPYGLTPQVQSYVLAHERHHLRRCDHLTRRLAFLLLTIHWFDPFCWLAFYLCGKDMELSCDEAVLGRGISTIDYSETLLSFAVKQKPFAPVPLAFGETGVKSRIKNVLGWHKPKAWVTALALALSVFVAIACATDAKPEELTEEGTIAALEQSLRYDGSTATMSFRVPDSRWVPGIHIAGRVEYPDMGGMSVHYLDGIDFEPGKEYSFTLYDVKAVSQRPVFTELTMTIHVGDIERDIDLASLLAGPGGQGNTSFPYSVVPTQDEGVKSALLKAALPSEELKFIKDSRIVFESALGGDDTRMVILRCESTVHAGGFGTLILGTLDRAAEAPTVREVYTLSGDDGRIDQVYMDEKGTQHILCTNVEISNGITYSKSGYYSFDGRSLQDSDGFHNVTAAMGQNLLEGALLDPADVDALHILGQYPVGGSSLVVAQYLPHEAENSTLIAALCDLEKESVLGSVHVLPGGSGEILRSYTDEEGRLHVECVSFLESLPDSIKQSAHYVTDGSTLTDLDFEGGTEEDRDFIAHTMDQLISGGDTRGGHWDDYKILVEDRAQGRKDSFTQYTYGYTNFYGTPGQRLTSPYVWRRVEKEELTRNGGDMTYTMSAGRLSLSFTSQGNYVIAADGEDVRYLRGDLRAAYRSDELLSPFAQCIQTSRDTYEVHLYREYCTVSGREKDDLTVAKELSRQFGEAVMDAPRWYAQVEDVRVEEVQLLDSYFGEDEPNFCFQVRYSYEGQGFEDVHTLCAYLAEDGVWRLGSPHQGGMGTSASIPADRMDAYSPAYADQLILDFFDTEGYSHDRYIPMRILQQDKEKLLPLLEKLPEDRREELQAALLSYLKAYPDGLSWSEEDLGGDGSPRAATEAELLYFRELFNGGDNNGLLRFAYAEPTEEALKPWLETLFYDAGRPASAKELQALTTMGLPTEMDVFSINRGRAAMLLKEWFAMDQETADRLAEEGLRELPYLDWTESWYLLHSDTQMQSYTFTDGAVEKGEWTLRYTAPYLHTEEGEGEFDVPMEVRLYLDSSRTCRVLSNERRK